MQQQRDTDQIDERNWQEWMQLFVDQLTANENRELMMTRLDKMEMVEYL